MGKVKIKKNLWRFLDLLPVAVPTALAAFGAVAIFFLLVNDFKSTYVWPLGLLAAAAAMVPLWRRYRFRAPGDKLEQRLCLILVLLGVLIWVGFNARYTSQHVFTNRDPGTYAVTGDWLVRHDNLQIPASQPFGQVSNLYTNSGGYDLDSLHKGKLFSQGTHILPAFLGLVGRAVGEGPMLHLNVVFGGTALLALYGFARLLVKPRWALAVAAAFALSLPLIHFSRDTYTEPLAATFTFSSLALLWGAIKTGKNNLWFLAGLVAGAGVLTRIDAYLELAAVLAFLIIYVAMSEVTKRRAASLQAVWWLVGAAITTILGLLDVYLLSHGYFLSQWHNIKPELALNFLIILIGLGIVFLSWRTAFLGWINRQTIRWRGDWLFWLTIIIAVALSARPLFYQAHQLRKIVSPTGVITHQTVRSYYELSVDWLVWYIGPLLSFAGFVGLAQAARRAMKDRSLLLLAPFFMIGGISLFYLLRPSIYADQVWASRRLLPVIMPGLLVFAAVFLERLYKTGLIKRINIEGKTLALIGGTLAVITPLFISLPFMFVREATWLAPVEDTCRALPKKAAVLWVGEARTELIEPTAAFCNAPAEGYGPSFQKLKPARADLAAAAANARARGYTPVIGVYGSDLNLVGQPSQLSQVSAYNYEWIEQPYTRPPLVYNHLSNTIDLGIIQPDGSIAPLASR